MFNFYCIAVKYGILSIDTVPAVYKGQVKESLGIKDPDPEQETIPTETDPDTIEIKNTEEDTPAK